MKDKLDFGNCEKENEPEQHQINDVENNYCRIIGFEKREQGSGLIVNS